MEFGYDPQKSISNKKKHGIDFEEAQILWQDGDRLQIQARSDTEARFALIAVYDNKLWTAFYTIRENRLRIISVRRARDEKKRLYHES